MKYGIWAPLPHVVRHEPRMAAAVSDLQTIGKGQGMADASFEFVVDVIRRAEDFGFDVTLIAERLQGPDLESWVLASALAQRTSAIRLMVAAHAGVVTPQMVAKMGASLDRVSGGRFCLNVIGGWWKEEIDLFGNGNWLDDPAERGARLTEFVDVMRGLWSNENFRFDGTYYRVNEGSLPIRPVRPGGPELYAAGRSEASRDMSASRCDTWFAGVTEGRDAFEENLAGLRDDVAAMQARAQGHGRMLGVGLSAHVICRPTMAEALREAEALEEYGQRDRIASIAARALAPGLVGTPELLAERIRAYEAAGVDLLMLRFSPMLEELEVFGNTVLPLVPPKSASAGNVS